jgi:hypothetical protein
MPNEVEFEPAAEQPPEQPSPDAQREVEQFKHGVKPNTAVIPLWKNGHISFNPESSVSVFALIALCLLLLTVLIQTFIGIWVAHTADWMASLATALGHAITGVVGAIVGSSVAKKDKSE